MIASTAIRTANPFLRKTDLQNISPKMACSVSVRKKRLLIAFRQDGPGFSRMSGSEARTPATPTPTKVLFAASSYELCDCGHVRYF
jgi:hypothetical protein